jgi:hypothetical protein
MGHCWAEVTGRRVYGVVKEVEDTERPWNDKDILSQAPHEIANSVIHLAAALACDEN